MRKPPSFRAHGRTARGSGGLQQAVDALNAGRVHEAEEKARLVLALRPDDAAALNVLGAAAIKRGRFAEAVQLLERAAAAQKKNPFIAMNLGEALRRSGRALDAVPHYRNAINLKPGFVEAQAQLGEALRAAGQVAEAMQAYRAALKRKPDLLIALKGLALTALRTRDFEEAVALFAKARGVAADMPTKALLSANLGTALIGTGAHADGLDALIDAVVLAPDVSAYWRMLASNLRHRKVVPQRPGFREILQKLLVRADINPRSVATAAVAVLKNDQDIAAFLSSLADDPARNAKEIDSAAAARLLQDPLFLTLVANAPVPDVGVEIFLTAWRRHALLGVVAGKTIDNFTFGIFCALAQQCFLNEYVYFMAEDEGPALARLAHMLAAPAGQNDLQAWGRLALMASYASLHQTAAREMDLSSVPEIFEPIACEQITEPCLEKEIQSKLKRLRPPTNQVSRAVQSQYEENPYPRWTRHTLGEPLPWRDAVHMALPYLTDSELPQAGTPHMLIAGCGTGLEIMRALNAYEGADITALDLSRTSLAYALRKLADYGVSTVRALHGDILNLNLLEESFDLIESFGVIHHMQEPARGLKVLRDVLKPGGFMRIGLYSTIARTGVVAARKVIAERGYAPQVNDIRAFRRHILSTPDLAPGLGVLKSPASDFWTTSDCRDLVFHTEEHHFTLLEIASMAARLGLIFLGLETSAADRLRFAAENLDPAAVRTLSAWHAFEMRHPETFGDTYRLWFTRPGAFPAGASQSQIGPA